MRIELREDADATRAIGRPVMHFDVQLDDGEVMTPKLLVHVRVLATQAAEAWEVIMDTENIWYGPVQ